MNLLRNDIQTLCLIYKKRYFVDTVFTLKPCILRKISTSKSNDSGLKNKNSNRARGVRRYVTDNFSNTSFKNRITIHNGNIDDESPVFEPRRALILTKMTRYEYEKKLCNSQGMVDEEDLKNHLEAKQSDYNGLLERHKTHFKALMTIKKHLIYSGIETEIVNRWQFDQKGIEWADVVFSAGGDGTFLLAASKMKNKNKPIIGLNTDPERSEGYLCLPKDNYSALNFGKALERLQSGNFRWKWRQRIRITMSGQHENEEPIELHDQQLNFPEHRFSEHIVENEEMQRDNLITKKSVENRVLPVLALNEVFIGESLSSRVSYYEIKIDNCPIHKQKSSGLTVCTGTGSSSWYFHINHLTQDSVKEILKIGNTFLGNKFCLDEETTLENITQAFNNSLRFDASEPYMAYTIRDPVNNAVYKVDKPRDFAKRIQIRSRMWDSSLVIDGGLSFRFNDGAVATLQIFNEDALRTVTFN